MSVTPKAVAAGASPVRRWLVHNFLEGGANIIAGRNGARATGPQYIEQKIIVPRKDATIRKFFIMPSM